MNASFDLNRCPLLVIWETTQACDLACCHCRACAQSKRNPLELTTLEAEKLIRDVADLRPPIFILTGGDPLKRPDIFYLVRRAVAHGLHPGDDAQRHAPAHARSHRRSETGPSLQNGRKP